MMMMIVSLLAERHPVGLYGIVTSLLSKTTLSIHGRNDSLLSLSPKAGFSCYTNNIVSVYLWMMLYSHPVRLPNFVFVGVV